MTNHLRSTIRAAARDKPVLKRLLLRTQQDLGLLHHELGRLVPAIMQPRPRRLTIAVTAHCNLRCIGCRYGRDFMPGAQLSLATVRSVLDDAKQAGIELVRLYGGEPLLHRDLPAMVRHATGLGLGTYVTTNATLLRSRIDALYDAGLRTLSIGYYGSGAAYDGYVQRRERFARLEEGIAYSRARYGSALSLQLNYLVMRRSLDVAALRAAWAFATRYDMTFHTDLVHYSLPYFTDGSEGGLACGPDDRVALDVFVRVLSQLKQAHPHRVRESLASIHSIPDWLLKGPQMRVPCDARHLIWVGADGTVQLCYVTFKLGNLHQQRLRDMLFTDAHRQAAKDAFLLNCPNCHCERDSRIQKHLASRMRYARLPGATASPDAPVAEAGTLLSGVR
jgi:cyclic pyranopterin phosphate synthase